MKPSKSIKLAKDKAIKYFNKFIRLRDQNKRCITCGTGAVSDCGHFISCRFEATRFDEKNAHGQCAKCNRFEYGNQFEHGQQIDLLYGSGTASKLSMKSKMFCKRNKFDFETIAALYAQKCKDLENN